MDGADSRRMAPQHRAESPDTNRARLENARDLMDFHLPRALVSGYEPRIETLILPDPNDRHVLAAAIEAGARTIVTFNRKDFPRAALSQWNIHTQLPDEFACDLLQNDAPKVVAALANQRARLQKPPLSTEQFLGNLRLQRLPRFVAALEPFKDRL